MSVQAKRRADYQPPAFSIATVDLHITLHPTQTKVTSTLSVTRSGTHNEPLVLDGDNLSLDTIAIDGKSLSSSEYTVTDCGLRVNTELDNFVLEITNTIAPEHNKALEGLYLSGGAYCTQCEAEGFRRITFFMDRPDVLAVYTVTVVADKSVPMLLANGNPVDKGDIDENTHFVKWHDPHPKPCYLFALVAGDFDVLTDSYTTSSGKEVALELYVDKGKKSQGIFALESLKRAMKWDEDVFGLEYDLDIYMIVAVDFFNMGAMENKGLNVFNSKFVLADQKSATDDDFFNVESVIAHEYFHNWTGNRVTCRDWFQLSLKEGLTVFRDQQFSADMTSTLSNRIKHVRVMREHQFAEDASAMSHPIRPEEVIEMNNFYTVTVYDKGAEVIRMFHTLLGPEGFRRGMDEYFRRHDGQAVTCDDFISAMQSATDLDLTQFSRWYSQSGTPTITVDHSTEPAGNDTYKHTFTLSQHTPATSDQSEKHPLYIPVNIEILDKLGNTYTDNESLIHDGMVILKEASLRFTVSANTAELTPVVLGNFSAPAKVDNPLDIDSLLTIFKHAKDPFNRWDAMQTLYDRCIKQIEEASGCAIDDSIWQGIKQAIAQEQGNLELLGECLVIPSFETLCQSRININVEALSKARQAFCDQFSRELEQELLHVFNSIEKTAYSYTQDAINKRRCKNVVLAHLARLPQHENIVVSQVDSADNMTDTLGALRSAQHCSSATFDRLMARFEQTWNHDPLVLDKWFALHATQNRDDIFATITMLCEHPQFAMSNPNRVRSVIGSFAFYNSEKFHSLDGSGYKFVTDYLLKLDAVNPQVAARIVTPLTQWQGFAVEHQQHMKHQLGRLLNHKGLSKDVFEKVSKSLAYDKQ
ncbi:aminopeptidase N [Alteromonas sp. IB21]|uniref:aminopeptidase N n=1 Tax=Alteromonas sp. IB21 TaxID=2779369 RepID=UPI0018E7A2A4|nr:aminopeptidase N [Alteromonas sp. IB21]MBJ2128403.1 aminopeptidase N [Alteromonas sp. IB21]